MRRAPSWQGALRTSVSCLPVNAALVVCFSEEDAPVFQRRPLYIAAWRRRGQGRDTALHSARQRTTSQHAAQRASFQDPRQYRRLTLYTG